MSSPRIIAGKARGMRLQDVPGDITRPITDRVKEGLFNILANDIPGSTFLDLFGGTGSVGIEALSRGAVFVRFIDRNRPAVNAIRANLAHTHLEENAQVFQNDAFQFLRQKPDRQFDTIFIAPPQYKGMWEQALKTLDEHLDWLDPSGRVIVQIDPVEFKSLDLTHLVEIQQRRYGSTLLIFYEIVQTSTETHE